VLTRIVEQNFIVAVRRVDPRVLTPRRRSTSALTVSRERAGAKRQSSDA